ncbi:MAG: response regulator [Anaerolineales bacterium]|nr:response regulator [Anaerolineales bacterium]
MPKVILIEDDKTMLSLLSTLLKMEGFEVTVAGDDTIPNLLATIQREKPQVALIDINLRNGNGMELLRMIRQQASLWDLKVIMSSGMDYRQECSLAGANSFLLKPYMPDELINLLKNTIGTNSQ